MDTFKKPLLFDSVLTNCLEDLKDLEGLESAIKELIRGCMGDDNVPLDDDQTDSLKEFCSTFHKKHKDDYYNGNFEPMRVDFYIYTLAYALISHYKDNMCHKNNATAIYSAVKSISASRKDLSLLTAMYLLKENQFSSEEPIPNQGKPKRTDHTSVLNPKLVL